MFLNCLSKFVALWEKYNLASPKLTQFKEKRVKRCKIKMNFEKNSIGGEGPRRIVAADEKIEHTIRRARILWTLICKKSLSVSCYCPSVQDRNVCVLYFWTYVDINTKSIIRPWPSVRISVISLKRYWPYLANILQQSWIRWLYSLLTH